MNKLVKWLKAFMLNSVDCVAPYTVFNAEFRKCHFCWTYKQALAWLACYDATDFGASYVANFNGDIVARKA